jgi:peroxiredoxin
MTLKVGDKAPDFKLYNTEKKEVSLSDYKGKNLVLLFFPAAFSGVCTAEMCAMRDSMSEYAKLDAEVVGISVDMPFSLAKFKEFEKLPFTLLSDFNKETIRAYGTYLENFAMGMHGVSKRAAFVVNKEGKIKYAEILDVVTNQPDFQKVKEALAA